LRDFAADVSVDAVPTPTADSDRTKPLLEKLETLLRDSDAEAADLIEEILPLVKESAMTSGLKQVASAIAAYDFDTALEQLVMLRKREPM
jgi:hypothetical protein